MSDIPAGGGARDLWGSHRRQRAVRSASGMRLDLRLAEIWGRRDVLMMFVRRGLKVKYAGSVLGYAWSLIEPGMYIAVYYLLVGRIFHIHRPDYALFIGSTMLPWLWFSGTVNGSLRTIRGNARLIKSIALPREIYPLAIVGERFVEFLASLPIIVIAAALYRDPPHLYAFALPLAIVMQLLLVTGFALFMSALSTVLRDVQRIIGIILRVLFYLTPVLYPMRQLHGWSRFIFELNPLVGIFELHRAVWFPQYFLSWGPVYVSMAGSLLIFVIGWLTFIRLERPVLKEL